MAGENLLVENSAIIAFDAPKNSATGVGDYFNMGNFAHCTIICTTEAVAQVVTWQIFQASDNAGTGLKALNYTVRYTKSGADINAIDSFTRTVVTATNQFASTSGEEFLGVLEFDSADLDADGGFSFISVIWGDPGASAQAIAAIGILSNPRYRQNIITDVLS